MGLRDEDKLNYVAQQKRYDISNNLFKEKNKEFNSLKYDHDELNVKFNTTVIKLKDLERQHNNLDVKCG